MTTVSLRHLTVGVEVEALTAPLFGLDAPVDALWPPRQLFTHEPPKALGVLADAVANRLRWQRDGFTIYSPQTPAARWTFWREPLTGTRAQTPFEVPSPVLKPQRLGDLERVCSALASLGCTVNESCGLHVHVGGLRPLDLVALVSFVYTWEECIYAVSGEARRTNLECRPVTPQYLERFAALAYRPHLSQAEVMARALELPVSEIGEDLDKFEMPRKYGLNLCALKLHGTAEFRYFPGTLDPALAAAYTRLAAHVAAAARAQGWRREERRPASDVLEFFHVIKLAEADIKTLAPTVDQSAEVRRCLERQRAEETQALAAAAAMGVRPCPMTAALTTTLTPDTHAAIARALAIVTNLNLPPLVSPDGDDHCGL